MIQKSFQNSKATLYIVSTPIGNLEDITYRAVNILKNVDYIFAEDTRHAQILLNHYQIKVPVVSYYEYNKTEKSEYGLTLLQADKSLALITDAGTPGISDPGYSLIKIAIENEFNVVSIPGASASLAALTASGLMMQPYVFLGFLPRKISDMQTVLERYIYAKETLIIYESPIRLLATLEKIYQVLGNRNIAIARELTKKFETIIRTTLQEALEMEHNNKGEYVIVISGFDGNHSSIDMSIEEHVTMFLRTGLSEKEAMKEVAKLRKMTKSEVYKAYKIK